MKEIRGWSAITSWVAAARHNLIRTQSWWNSRKVRVAVKYRRVLKSIKSGATTQRAPRRLHNNKINHRLALKCFIPTYLYTGRNIDGWINLNVGNTILLCGTPGGRRRVWAPTISPDKTDDSPCPRRFVFQPFHSNRHGSKTICICCNILVMFRVFWAIFISTTTQNYIKIIRSNWFNDINLRVNDKTSQNAKFHIIDWYSIYFISE